MYSVVTKNNGYVVTIDKSGIIEGGFWLNKKAAIEHKNRLTIAAKEYAKKLTEARRNAKQKKQSDVL